MSAVLPSPPPGVRMRPFRVVAPILVLDDFAAVAPNSSDEVICVGPFPNDDGCGSEGAKRVIDSESYIRWLLEPKQFASGGQYVCRAEHGRYVTLWFVAEGRPRARGPGARVHWDHSPRKLAHWDTLEAGVAMLLCPEPDDEAIEDAIARTAYMRSKGRGRFQPFFDDAGALWVTRLPEAP